jgi:hypothetical protein
MGDSFADGPAANGPTADESRSAGEPRGTADVDAAERGRAIVAEARAVRRRMLDDAEQRRRALLAALEGVRAEIDAAIAALAAAAPAGAAAPGSAAPPEAAVEPAARSRLPGAPGPPAPTAAPVPPGSSAPRAPSAPEPAPAAPARVEALFDALRGDTPAPASRPAPAPAATATKTRTARPSAPTPSVTTERDPEATDPGGVVVAAPPEVGSDSVDVPAATPAATSAAPRGPAATPTAGPEDAIRRRRDALVEPLVPEVMRASKRLLQDEQNSLLDVVRRTRGRLEPGRLLPEPVRQRESWTALLGRSIDAAYLGGRAAAGKTGRVTNAPARLVVELAALLVLPLRERVSSTIDTVVAEGPYESTNELQRALGSAIGARYREWRTVDLEEHTFDLLAAAYARGAYDAAPPAAMLRWIPAQPGRCPDCDDNALEPTLKGKAFPTGQPHPPAHPGCRCILVLADP